MVHVIFLIAVLLAACSVGRKENRTYLYWLSFFALFIFAALRYDFGNDYMSYYHNYIAIKRGDWSTYGNQYLFTIINYISPSFDFLVISTSFLFLRSVYRLLKDTLSAEYIWLGLFIFLFSPYIFLVNLSAMRQCLAMLLFVAATKYAINGSVRNFIKYAVVIIIATLIHKSAILLLPIYFLANNKPIKRVHIELVLVITALLLLSEKLFPTLIDSFLAAFADKNYNSYVASGNKNSLRSILLSFIPLFYLLLNAHRIQQERLVYTKLSAISYLLSILALQSTVLIRLRMYFEIFSCVAIPTTYFTAKGQHIAETKEYSDIGRRFFYIINRYILPLLILLIYLLKYYNFFQETVWQSFSTYKTILWR